MKVTFIYPGLADCGFNASSGDTLLRYIHHGLCYLSSCAKASGFETSLIDLRTLGGWDDFSKKIKEESPRVAAITMMSPDYNYAVRSAQLVKESDPRTIVVVGGIHPTIMPDEVASNKSIDYVVKGEGEAVFVELLDKIKGGADAGGILEGKRVDVETLPHIDRHLFNCLEYPFDFFLPMPFFTVMAGRGCSYNCKFCAPASKMVHGRGARRRSVASVIEELKLLRGKYGMKSFMFHDDCFTENKDWVMEFCARYKENGFREDFICQTRADIVCKNPLMMKMLAKAGLKMVMIGFESGNDRVLKFIGKGATVRQNLASAKICAHNGIRVWALHMFGLPTETNEEANDTVRMIKRMKPYRSSAAFFTPHPGSYLYKYCKENNLSLIDDHDDIVRVPEEDKPKIKNVDYGFMRKAASESKSLPMRSKMMIRFDRIFRCRANRRFLRAFRELERGRPSLNKLDILASMRTKYR